MCFTKINIRLHEYLSFTICGSRPLSHSNVSLSCTPCIVYCIIYYFYNPLHYNERECILLFMATNDLLRVRNIRSKFIRFFLL